MLDDGAKHNEPHFHSMNRRKTGKTANCMKFAASPLEVFQSYHKMPGTDLNDVGKCGDFPLKEKL